MSTKPIFTHKPLHNLKHIPLFTLIALLSVGLFPRTTFASEMTSDPNQETIALEEPSYASIQTSGDYTYLVENGSAIITAYTGTDRDVVIPSTLGGCPITKLEERIFENNQSIDSVTVPEGVTDTSKMLFAHSSVKVVNMPSTWTNYYTCMFAGCRQLTAINVPQSNPYLCTIQGDLYSKDQSKLIFYAGGKPETTFTIPSTVKSIGPGFDATSHLEVLNVPDSVQSVEYGSFGGASLKIVNIGKSLQDVDGGAFRGPFGNNLEAVNIDSNNPYLASEDGVLYNKSKTTIIYYPSRKSGNSNNGQSFIAPTTVTSVGYSAFDRCAGVSEIVFPTKIVS